MVEQNIAIDKIGQYPIQIGYAGDNEHTVVNFYGTEIFTEYPNADVQLVVSPYEEDSYPAVVTVENGVVKWEVTASDTRSAGNGTYQLVFTDNDTEVWHSAVGKYIVKYSIDVDGEAPDPIQNWIDNAEETAQEIAEAAAQTAIEIAGDTQIAAIEAAGQDVLDSIPADYTALTEQVSDLNSALTLQEENVPGTTQTISFDSVGNVSQIVHSANGVAVRTDVFTFGADTITEVRTLSTGESLTIVTNTDTLVTTTTYADAV